MEKIFAKSLVEHQGSARDSDICLMSPLPVIGILELLLAKLAIKKSNWPALNVINGRFVQPSSKAFFFLNGPPLSII